MKREICKTLIIALVVGSSVGGIANAQTTEIDSSTEAEQNGGEDTIVHIDAGKMKDTEPKDIRIIATKNGNILKSRDKDVALLVAAGNNPLTVKLIARQGDNSITSETGATISIGGDSNLLIKAEDGNNKLTSEQGNAIQLHSGRIFLQSANHVIKSAKTSLVVDKGYLNIGGVPKANANSAMDRDNVQSEVVATSINIIGGTDASEITLHDEGTAKLQASTIILGDDQPSRAGTNSIVVDTSGVGKDLEIESPENSQIKIYGGLVAKGGAIQIDTHMNSGDGSSIDKNTSIYIKGNLKAGSEATGQSGSTGSIHIKSPGKLILCGERADTLGAGDIVMELNGDIVAKNMVLSAHATTKAKVVSHNGEITLKGINGGEQAQIEVNSKHDMVINDDVSAEGKSSIKLGNDHQEQIIINGNVKNNGAKIDIQAQKIRVATQMIISNGGRTKLQGGDTVELGNVEVSGNNSEISITGTQINIDKLTEGDTGVVELKGLAKINEYDTNNYHRKIMPGEIFNVNVLKTTVKGEHTFSFALAGKPKQSAYLILTQAPDNQQDINWINLKSADKEKGSIEQLADVLHDNKEGLKRVPFAVVIQPGNTDLFAVGSKPKLELNPVENIDITVGKEELARATELDRNFLRHAGITDYGKGVFYYGGVNVTLDGHIPNYMNALAAANSVMAIDMVDSVRTGTMSNSNAEEWLSPTTTLWTRYQNVQYRPEGSSLSANKLEIGTERSLRFNKYNSYLGFSFSYDQAHGSIAAPDSELTTKKYEGRAYLTTYLPKGRYTNFVVRAGHLSHEFHFNNIGSRLNSSYGNNLWGVSGEYGMQMQLNKGWYLIPQAQLQLTHLTAGNFNMAGDIITRYDSINSVRARVGALAGKVITTGNRQIKVYGTADIFHEFAGSQAIALTATNRYSWSHQQRGIWYRLGLGTAMQLNTVAEAQLSVAKSFGAKAVQSTEIQAKLQFKF